MTELQQAEQQQALAGLQKQRSGQKLTREESAAVKKFLKAKEEREREEHYRTVPQKDYRRMSGRQPKVLKEQEDAYGLPCGGKVIDLFELLRGFHDFLAKHGRKCMQPDDPLMVGPGSPALERYRDIKAKREDLAHKRDLGQVRSLEEVATIWNQLAAALRQACETIQRQNLAGPEAVQQIRETLTSARQNLVIMLGEDGETDGETELSGGANDCGSDDEPCAPP
jgi:hypothetical protein